MNIINYSLLLTVSLLFIIFYLMLSYFNRFVSDDFFLISRMNELGWFNAVKNHPYNIRWSSHLSFTMVFASAESFKEYASYIFIYHITIIALLVFALFRLLTVVFSRFINKMPSIFIRINYSVLTAGAFYFVTVQAQEVWFWITATFVYFLSYTFSILGTAIILKKKNTWIDYLILCICFAYIGGAVENYAIVVLCILLLTMIYLIRKPHTSFYNALRSSHFIKKLMIAFISAGFIFSLGFPSYSVVFYNRITNISSIIKPAPAEKQTTTAKTDIQRIIKACMQKKYIAFFFLITPFLWLGSYARRNNYAFKYESLNIRKTLLYGAIAIVILTLILFIPVMTIRNNFNLPDERTWTPICMFTLFAVCIICFYAGYTKAILQKFGNLILRIALLINVLLLTTYIIRQYPLVSTYAKAYDQRIIHLLTLEDKGIKETVTLSPLPPSGMLIKGDVTDDVKHYNNVVYQKALKLNFNVKIPLQQP